jgi:hypothetical protein
LQFPVELDYGTILNKLKTYCSFSALAFNSLNVVTINTQNRTGQQIKDGFWH